MNVTCPNCGAENAADAIGEEVVCGSCFHAWIIEDPGGTAAAEPTVSLDLSDDDPFGEALGLDLSDDPFGDVSTPDAPVEGPPPLPGGDAFGDISPLGVGSTQVVGDATSQITVMSDEPTQLDSEDFAMVAEEPPAVPESADASEDLYEESFGDAADPTGDLPDFDGLLGDSELGGSELGGSELGGGDFGDELADMDLGDGLEGASVDPMSDEALDVIPKNPPRDPALAKDDVEQDTSFLFRRRRHRSLSETDVAMIGTYQRRSTEIPQSDDVVWKPGDGPPPRSTSDVGRAPAAGAAPGASGGTRPGIDPFGDTEVVWGAGGDTTGSSSSWAQDEAGSSDTMAIDASPLGGGAPNSTSPFDAGGASGGGFGGAPAGGSGEDFGSETYAFGEPVGGGGDPNDPFADISSNGLSDDPFASNPFADDGAEDANPFGSAGSGGGFDVAGAASSGGNPFSTADFATGDGVGGGLEELDFSALGEDAPDPLPPSGDEIHEMATFVDGGATTGGGGFGGRAGARGGGRGGDSDDSLFELDMPDAGGGGGGSLSMGADGPARPAAGGGGKRRRRKRGGKSGGKSGGSRKGVMLAFLGVVLVGGAMGQTDLGYFGVNVLLGDDSGPRPVPGEVSEADPRQRPGQASGAKKEPTSMKADSSRNYMDSIASLDRKLQANPADTDSRDRLVMTLLRFKQRYPTVYKNDPHYSDLEKRLLTPDQVANDMQLRINKLLAEGKVEEADAAMEEYRATMTRNPDALYMMASLEVMKGNKDRAINYYKRTIEAAPDYEPALFDLGDIYLERQEIAEARIYFDMLLKKNPDHSSGKLAMAQITLYEKGYDEAKELIEGALALAKDSKNPDQQFRAFWLQAMLADAQQKVEEKGYALGRALEIKPTDERTALALADLLRTQDKHPEALRRLKQCQKAGCSSAEFYKSLVQAYHANSDADAARSQLNEALRKHPNDTGLLMLQAAEEIQAEHFKTAKAIYATIIEHDPTHIDAYLKLSVLQFREGRQQEAIETLTRGGELAEEKLPLMEKKAELQMKVGATLKAKETMGLILQLDPNNTAVKGRFAKLLKGLGFADEASRYYQDLHVAGALEATDLLDYAEVLIALKRFDEALKLVTTVIDTDPLNLLANVLRGAVRTEKGEFKEADEDLRRALKVDSESPLAYYHLGRNESAQNRMPSAVEYLSKAVSLDTENLPIRFDLARALTKVGGVDNRRTALAQYNYIIKEYERFTSGIDKKRIDPQVYFLRGGLHFDNGQFREALADFNKAMVLDPVRMDTVIEFARTLQTMGKRQEAEAYLNEVLTRDPKNPSAHFQLGVINLKSGKRTKAEDHFKQAIAAGGANFPVAHRYLGYLYKEKGLTALACNSFREYLRVAEKNAYDREEIARVVQRMCRGR